MADPASFFARWSRLKRQAERPPAERAGAVPETSGVTQAETPAAVELPSIETLTPESDFTPFMRADVPEALRNAALQKLWRSDPIYANLDGLLEYGEDYAAKFRDTTAANTVYRVLQGMPDGEVPTKVPSLSETAPEPHTVVADAAPAAPEVAISAAEEGTESDIPPAP